MSALIPSGVGEKTIDSSQRVEKVTVIDELEMTSLKRAKARLEAILNSTSDGIALYHAEEGIQQTNNAFNTLFGCQPDEWFGSLLMQHAHPDDTAQLAEWINTVKQGGAVQQVEFRAQRADGTYFWAELDMAPMVYEDNRRGNLICNLRNISPRKDAEAALQQTQNLLKSILDYSPMMIQVKDKDGHFVMANRFAAQQMGVTPEAVVGKTIGDLLPEQTAIVVDNATDQQVLETDTPVEVEIAMQHSDGDHTYAFTKFPLRDAEGQTFALGVIGVDISHRKRMEQELMRETQLLMTLIDTIPDLIFAKDRQRRFTLMNMAHARVFHLMPFQAIGKTDADIHSSDYLKDYVHDDEQIFKTGESLLNKEEIVVGTDGQQYTMLTTKVPLRDNEGNIIGLVGVARDISERKRIEEELRLAYERERELNELKSRFVSMASHEFRTPLASIMASTDTLRAYRHRMDEQKIEQRLNNIIDQVNHLSDVVDNVLTLSRAQAGRIDFHPTELDVDALCRQIIEEFATRPDITHEFAYSGTYLPLNASVDKKLFWHILANLLSNAVKYAPESPLIVISLKEVDEHIELRVRDQGIGIPPDDMQHLFELFHRGMNVGAIGGTGLGLSITKHAVDLHGGTIEVHSEVNVGTTFTVTLPIRREE
jgi:PAS domain S-box-containing protein